MSKNRKYIEEISKKLVSLIEDLSNDDIMSFIALKNELIKERVGKYGPNPDFVSMDIRDKLYPGMYFHNLLMTDIFTTKRWGYWSEILVTKDISKDIPQIDFGNVSTNEGRRVSDMLRYCINTPYTHGATAFNNFISYLLYCLMPLNYHKGETVQEKEIEANKLIANIDDRSLKNYYENFSLEAMMLFPGDYLGDLAAEYLGSNGTEYFPTPHHIVDLMIQITMGEGDKEDNKTKAVCDPCAGSSRMLLYASNNSLRVSGMDISKAIVNVSMVNGFLYVPWMVFVTDEINAILQDKENMSVYFDEIVREFKTSLEEKEVEVTSMVEITEDEIEEIVNEEEVVE